MDNDNKLYDVVIDRACFKLAELMKKHYFLCFGFKENKYKNQVTITIGEEYREEVYDVKAYIKDNRLVVNEEMLMSYEQLDALSSGEPEEINKFYL